MIITKIFIENYLGISRFKTGQPCSKAEYNRAFKRILRDLEKVLS